MSSERVTLKARFRYAFDNSMANGPIALVGWLALLCAAVIFVIALVVRLLHLAPAGMSPLEEAGRLEPGFLELIWIEIMRTLDAGTMGGDRGDWSFLLSMLATTLLGVFAISTLIGVLTSSIEGKMEDLQRGRSHVLERNHTLILGWSPQIFDIIAQCVLANANRKDGRIVILAERDMRSMKQEIRDRIPDLRTTRLICRTGNPIDLGDLAIVNPTAAKSIIILQPERPDPDAHVIKAILALTRSPSIRQEHHHIVADIRSLDDVAAARLVGGASVCPVITSDIISGIIVQTCRQSGLSVVFHDVFDFEGSEIYLHAEPSLRGRTFGEALFAYEHSIVLGLRSPGAVRLNPPPETVIGPEDELIVLAEDDDTTTLSHGSEDGRFLPATLVEGHAINLGPVEPDYPERTLILGWNHRVPLIVKEMDGFLVAGSTIVIVARGDLDTMVSALPADVRNVRAVVRNGDIAQRPLLESLDPASFDQVIVLPYSDELDTQSADAISLVTLLHLRDLLQGTKNHPRIVTEMLDSRNRDLAEVTGADDYVVSNHLASLMMAQISENPCLCQIFEELLDPRGSELSLKPAGQYVAVGHETTFATIVEAARRRREIAVGYRLTASAHDADASYGVVLNPRKSARVVLGIDDKVIVLAEN